jgi:hypothetical protein
MDVVCFKQLQTWQWCETLRLHIYKLTQSEYISVEIMHINGSLNDNLLLWLVSPCGLKYFEESKCNDFPAYWKSRVSNKGVCNGISGGTVPSVCLSKTS